MKEVIFADKDNYKSIVKQLRFTWIREVLSKTGMNLEDCFPESDDINEQTIQQKVKLRKTLSDNKITVVDNNDDSLLIYVQDTLIAQWATPLYDRREDKSQKDRTKRYYIGITIEYQSVFDNDVETD